MTTEAVPSTAPSKEQFPAENMHRSRRDELDNVVVDKMELLGLALLAGPANVIMQLAVPAVGYGVYESKVESGMLFKNPTKRTRTTLTYLAVAAMGSPELRKKYRLAVNKSHVHVRSDENSPVKYNAFDPQLQLWVAACLYKGWEDVQRIYGNSAILTEEAYQQGAVMGTTLQMPRELWPATRSDFEEYWNSTVANLEIDDTIRDYLMQIVRIEFVHPVIRKLFGKYSEAVTIGFLPEDFRKKMRITQTPAQRRFFDAHNAVLRFILRFLPGPLRRFPLNAFLVDLRWRLRTGRPLV